MTTRQKQLIENYIRLKVKKAISEKKVLKEAIEYNNMSKEEFKKFSSALETIKKSINAVIDKYGDFDDRIREELEVSLEHIDFAAEIGNYEY